MLCQKMLEMKFSAVFYVKRSDQNPALVTPIKQWRLHFVKVGPWAAMGGVHGEVNDWLKELLPGP